MAMPDVFLLDDLLQAANALHGTLYGLQCVIFGLDALQHDVPCFFLSCRPHTTTLFSVYMYIYMSERVGMRPDHFCCFIRFPCFFFSGSIEECTCIVCTTDGIARVMLARVRFSC